MAEDELYCENVKKDLTTLEGEKLEPESAALFRIRSGTPQLYQGGGDAALFPVGHLTHDRRFGAGSGFDLILQRS